VPLALAGRAIDLSRLEHCILQMQRRRWIRLEMVSRSGNDGLTHYWLDTVLTACEILAARSGNRDLIASVLSLFAEPAYRHLDRLETYHDSLLDLQLRAQALILKAAGRSLTVEDFAVDPAEPGDKSGKKTPTRSYDQKERLRSFLRHLIPLYEARARILLAGSSPSDIHKLFPDLVSALALDEYSFNLAHSASAIRKKGAVAVSYLNCIPTLDSAALLKHTMGVFGRATDQLGSDELAALPVFAFNRELHAPIIEILTRRAQSIIGARKPANQKIEALLEVARFVDPISRDDARALFGEAHKITEEIDVEAMEQLQAVDAIAIRGAPAMERAVRRQTAEDLSFITADAAVRLSGYDGFPWRAGVEALTVLDFPAALARLSRWQDSGTLDLESSVPTALDMALREGTVSAEEAAALCPLIEYRRGVLDPLSKRLKSTRPDRQSLIVEDLARGELLRWTTSGSVGALVQFRDSFPSPPVPGPWYLALQNTVNFLNRQSSAATDAESALPAHSYDAPLLPSTCPPCTSTDQILAAIRAQYDSAQEHDGFVTSVQTLQRLCESVPVADRTTYLDALDAIPPDRLSNYEIVSAIYHAIQHWGPTPGVRQWCYEHLPRIIVKRFSGFLQDYHYSGESALGAFAKILAANNQNIPKILATAIGAHVHILKSSTVYTLAELIADYVSPADSATTAAAYISRLSVRVAPEYADRINIADIPNSNESAIARFLFALMSDCDVRVRWRAAHCVRRFARYGLTTTLDRLIELYDSKGDSVFRLPDAPFFWLAARLWLTIALHRAARDTPKAIAPYAAKLRAIATDDTLPHVLLREFAKDTAQFLSDNGYLALPRPEKRRLKETNTSRLPRRNESREYRLGDGQSRGKDRHSRAFHFDSLDTIPYWYSPALDMFVDVDLEEFLDSAERWIVNEWHAGGDAWKSGYEQRRDRYSDRNWVLATNDHGSLPTLEQYQTYLERHAMFCTVGEFLKSRRVTGSTDAQDMPYDTFEGWLQRDGLTLPPLWLADMRRPKPLERRFWYEPSQIDQWLTSPKDEEFLCELGVTAREGWVVVKAWHETGSQHFESRVNVSSALVEGQTAGALVRSLQTAKDPYDYGLPYEEHDFEIDESPYRLLGWLEHWSGSGRLDSNDPHRRSLEGVLFLPGKKIPDIYRTTSPDGGVIWVDRKGVPAFEYEGWSDVQHERGEERYRIDMQSAGARLWASTSFLQRYLLAVDMDLVLSVTLIREKGDGRYRYAEKREETRQAKVVVFRRDGTISDANGHIGAWQNARSRA
jgi:hypothetical protein